MGAGNRLRVIPRPTLRLSKGHLRSLTESFKVPFHLKVPVFFDYILLCNKVIINLLGLKIIKFCNIISSCLEENQKPFLTQ